MAGSDRGKQKKKDQKAKKKQERLQGKARFNERGAYELEYQRVKAAALSENPMLLGIYECSDDEFYVMDRAKLFQRLGIVGYSRIDFDLSDKLEFDKDPTVSNGLVNEVRKRRTDAITGFTSVLEKDTVRRSAVFMRRSTPSVLQRETLFAFKLIALFHELGHVDDILKGLNYSGQNLLLVDAEVYAHHYTCKQLTLHKHWLLLKSYLSSLAEMAKSPSEFVSIAASKVLDSPEHSAYKLDASR